MAIIIKSIRPLNYGAVFGITIADEDDLSDTDIDGTKNYRTYTIEYDPTDGRASLRAKIVHLLGVAKHRPHTRHSVRADVLAVLENINADEI